jgi:hypothetical protein
MTVFSFIVTNDKERDSMEGAKEKAKVAINGVWSISNIDYYVASEKVQTGWCGWHGARRI